ncbi:VOC family protein [Nocardioides terrigena]|uniref:VOC family protein n=1 Tax=Nocardioides terrigena TaxID=424797 RepID=UPI000D30D738|nr:VOC family protein [Nocardioides terrigena]
MSLAHSGVALMLPVTDVDRATRFYQQSLGLEFTGTNDEGSAMFAVGSDAQLVLLPRPESKPSESTAMSFEVDDVTAEIRTLEGRGVVFEDYDLPDLKTVDHVCEFGDEKAAWFKDPDGNVLCLHEDLT